jgi:glycerophosphoryl diester phosphodiesterase
MIGNAFQWFGRSLSTLLAYEVLFRMLSLNLLAPLTAWVITGFIATTGSVAVNDYHLAEFLFSTTGLTALVTGGGILLALLYIEQAGLFYLASAASRKQKLGSLPALWATFRSIPRLLKLGMLQVGICLVILVPFAALAAITYQLLLSTNDINFYLSTQPQEFWTAVAIGSALGVGYLIALVFLYLRWIFAIPLVLFDGCRTRAALRQSAEMGLNHRHQLALFAIGWPLVVLLGSAMITLLLDWVSEAVLASVGQGVQVAVVAVLLLITMHLLVAVAIALVGGPIYCFLITRLYLDLNGSVSPEPRDALTTASAPPLRRWHIWALACSFLMVAALVFWQIVANVSIEDQVAVTAHRGSSLAAPENTMSAVRLAIEQGADFAEIDVQETADGEIVLLHDDDLMRIASLNKRISELSFAEVQELDAGSWFSREYAGERIPRLLDIIELARGRIKLNIELKGTQKPSRVTQRVVEMVRQQDFLGQCVITSIDREALREAKKLEERLEVGQIVTVSVGDITRLDVDFLSVSAKNVNQQLIRAAGRSGKQIHVWTVNNPRQMSTMINLGVDNIITDDPPVLVDLLQQRSSLSNLERVLLGFRVWFTQ